MKNAAPLSLQTNLCVHAYLTTGSRGLLRPCLGRRVDSRHYELESRTAAIAGCDPASAPKGSLHHEPAQVEAKAQAPLRAVASGRAGLFEQPVKACGREARPVVRNCDLQPATGRRPRLHQNGFVRVFEGIPDQVGEDLSQVSRFASGGGKPIGETDLDS